MMIFLYPNMNVWEFALHKIDGWEIVYGLIARSSQGLGSGLQHTIQIFHSLSRSFYNWFTLWACIVLRTPPMSFHNHHYPFFLRFGTEGKNHRKCVLCDSGCHWLVCRKGRVDKSPLNAPWLPSTQMMDSSWRGIMEGSEGLFLYYTTTHTYTHVYVYVCVCKTIQRAYRFSSPLFSAW